MKSYLFMITVSFENQLDLFGKITENVEKEE